jgi:hypothetical protein
MRAFGTTDTALILERFTCGLQRLRALEAEVLAGPPTCPETRSANPWAPPHPRASRPHPSHPASRQRTSISSRPSCPIGAPPHRSAPPAHPAPDSVRKNPNGAEPSSHTLGGMVGPAMPIPRPAQSSAAR